MEHATNEQVFSREYIKCNNIHIAAKASNIELSETIPAGYYVYFLIEKEAAKIFYIGKGKANRVKSHFRTNNVDNVFKANEIDDIIERGNTPSFVIFKSFADENEAYRVEKLLIENLSVTGLTNERKGCSSLLEREMLKTKKLLERIIPFEIWMRLKPRTKSSISNYHFIVRELNEIISIPL